MASNEGIVCDFRYFRKLLTVISKYYESWKCINKLKVLYTDHLRTRELYKAKTTLELLDLLIYSGYLNPGKLKILFDTIKATECFDLEKKINDQVPSCPNIRGIEISEFRAHRLKLMKLGETLTDEDVQSISGLYFSEKKSYEDSWSLIMFLERKRIIREGDMGEFIENLEETLEIINAAECLTKDITMSSPSSGIGSGEAVSLRMDRNRQDTESEDEPPQNDPLMSLNFTVSREGKLRTEFYVELQPFREWFRKILVFLEELCSGSLVFRVSVSDANALENLYNISLSGELIQGLAKEFVPSEFQEKFLKRWSTYINEEEYDVALSKLRANGKCDLHHFCIISDDPEWETTLMEELKQKRPDLHYTFMKRWRLDKPETINHIIGQSKNVIVGFSPKPLADYSKYAAHSVVLEMLEANTLDSDKIIPLLISEDAVVPPEFKSFTCYVWEELFIGRLMQNFNKCEPAMEIRDENTDVSIDNIPEMDVKVSNAGFSKTSSSCGSGEDISMRFTCSLDAKSEDERHQKDPLLSVKNTVDKHGQLTAKRTCECVPEIEPALKHFKKMSVCIKRIGPGSLVFYLYVSDSNALENLYNANLRGQLIQDLAEVLVPADLQKEFIDRWSTDIDKEEYEAALTRLKAKGQHDFHHFCIISDDPEWETRLMEELKQKRPDLSYTFMKRWILDKPETINHIIGQSKNVIVGFSPKPFADYSKYAAHSVVVEMLGANTLDDSRIIPFKITADGLVPPQFVSFQCHVWEELFVDKLLHNFDKSESQMKIIEGNTDPSIGNLPEFVVKDSKEVQSDLYDFCILSDNSEWENKLMGELQERIPDIKCTSKQDLSELNKVNLINRIDKSEKVILGFSAKPATVTANVVEGMLEGNTLHHAKFIPVKISEDALVPLDFKLFTVANGWDDFVTELEKTYAKSMKTYTDSLYDPEDQNMKRSGSQASFSSYSSGYSTATDMTSESTEPEDKSTSESDTTSDLTVEPKPEFDETENFKVIESMVIKLGTKKMKEIFFKAFLENESKKGSFAQLKDYRLKYKMFSPDADFNKFDIEILMTLIRYCCGFTYPDEDWEEPDRIDNTVLSNLIHIQKYKKTLDQKENHRISTNKFEEEWDRMKKVFLDLGVPSKDVDIMKLRTDLNKVYFEEIQNFQAIMSLVLELGTAALRKYVLQVNNIQDVGQFLEDEKDNLKAKLLPEQKKKVFSKKADIRSFDIPILMKIIRHCNQLPDSFWSEPDEEYIKKLANLVKIHRYSTTKLAHRANARMSNKEFLMEWNNLTFILKGVGVPIEEIEKYKPLHLTASTS